MPWPGLRIPAELTLDQQIHGAGVVAIVLQDELLPGQGEEILGFRSTGGIRMALGMATFENIYEKNDDDDDEEEDDDDIYCKLRRYLYHRFCRNSIRM